MIEFETSHSGESLTRDIITWWIFHLRTKHIDVLHFRKNTRFPSFFQK